MPRGYLCGYDILLVTVLPLAKMIIKSLLGNKKEEE